jgi:hypothetical protein
MTAHGSTQPSGNFRLEVVRALPQRSRVPERELSMSEIIHHGFPAKYQPSAVRLWKKANLQHFWGGLRRYCAARVLGLPMAYGRLSFLVIRADGTVEDLLLVGIAELVTTAGVNFIAARLANTTPADISLFNFHAIGTGTTAAAVGDTALQTEITTQYLTNNTRPTGTQSNPSANIYQSTATVTVDASVAATEWGLLTQAATGGGTLLDRKVYTVVNLAASDSLVPTYQLTLPSGG